MSYYRASLARVRRWAPRRTENDNFYYGLSEKNRGDMVALVSVVTRVRIETLEGYLAELDEDLELREHIRSMWADDPRMRDAVLGYGRREGWYLFVRALKPRVVIETGVHHGVGACVLASALIRNQQEGWPGKYYGTDINPNAGVLFTGRYEETGRILIGDSIESISGLGETVDMFINDSDHSASYEGQEYQTVAQMLSPNALLLGDNSHVTEELRNFARSMEWSFLFFKEEPRGHWYPGAGIGVCASRIPLNINQRESL